MNLRIHAARVIARRKTLETVLNPGFYIAQTAGLLLGYILITGFTGAIDSSGFSFELNPVYDFVGRAMVGAFGRTFVDKLFSEGPFLLALYISFLPSFFYLSINSVFRFSFEKKVGAIELISYGPADGTSCFLASYVKDILLTLLTIAILFIYFAVAAFNNNIVLGSRFLYSVPLILFTSSALYAYGILAAVATDNAVSAISLYMGIVIFFLIILMGTFSIVSGYVSTLSGVFTRIAGWLSPLFYWNLSLTGVESGNAGFFITGIVILSVLTGIVLFASHLIVGVKGVRK